MHDKIKTLKAIYEANYTKSQLALMLAIRDVVVDTNGVLPQTKNPHWYKTMIKKMLNVFDINKR